MPRKKNPNARPYVRRAALRQAILDNERLNGTALYKSVPEIAQEFEVPLQTVHQLRHRLAIKHRTMTEDPKNSNKKITTLLPAVTTTEGLLKILEDEPLLSSLDRLRVLSRLIRTGPPAIKITAIKTYEDLTRVSVEQVGPPDPLTHDEAVARLARLHMAVGQEIADEAYTVAFGDPNEEKAELSPREPEAPLQTEPEPVRQDGPEPEPPLPNLSPPEAPSGGPQP